MVSIQEFIKGLLSQVILEALGHSRVGTFQMRLVKCKINVLMTVLYAFEIFLWALCSTQQLVSNLLKPM